MCPWSWGPSIASYHSVKFGDHRYCGSANIRSYISHETTWSKGHLTRYVSLLMVSYHPAKFDGHRYCGRADIRLYICHMTTWSKGHETWWMLSHTLCHHPLWGRYNISNPNANFNFNVCKLPTFSLNHEHLSPAPFVNAYKIETRFQFSSLYFVNHIFNDYLVE